MQCAESFLIWHDKKILKFCSVQPVEVQKNITPKNNVAMVLYIEVNASDQKDYAFLNFIYWLGFLPRLLFFFKMLAVNLRDYLHR